MGAMDTKLGRIYCIISGTILTPGPQNKRMAYEKELIGVYKSVSEFLHFAPNIFYVVFSVKCENLSRG